MKLKFLKRRALFSYQRASIMQWFHQRRVLSEGVKSPKSGQLLGVKERLNCMLSGDRWAYYLFTVCSSCDRKQLVFIHVYGLYS